MEKKLSEKDKEHIKYTMAVLFELYRCCDHTNFEDEQSEPSNLLGGMEQDLWTKLIKLSELSGIDYHNIDDVTKSERLGSKIILG